MAARVRLHWRFIFDTQLLGVSTSHLPESSTSVSIVLIELSRTFYHQLLRRGMSSVAHFFSHKCLRLSRHTWLSRYVHMTMVFVISGIFHALCDLTQGIPLDQSGALQFFVMQAFAIMFEDLATAFLRRFGVNTGKTKPSAAARVLGYFWVVAWLAWSTPVWIFPSLQRDKGNPIIPIPASISEFLRSLSYHYTS